MNRKGLRIFGWVLVIGSFPVWYALFLAPFLPLPIPQRFVAAGAFAAAGEIMFWVGGFILGADVVARFRRPKATTGKSFAGKRAAVVGASGGLGSEIARALHREGATVVLIGRSGDKLAPLAEELGAEALIADITDPASLQVAAEQCGKLDTLVCATGRDTRKAFSATTAEEVREELAVNLEGPMNVARAFVPRIAKGGSLGVLGGFADGRLAFPYYSADVASRAGLAGFCESLNRELVLEGRDVKLCYVCPAPADTEAERPYAQLWSQMGAAPVAPAKVADFTLSSLLARRPMNVMGYSTRMLARVNKLSPGLADLVGVRYMGELLKERFGS
jgi:short-subunit dehydrogenase